MKATIGGVSRVVDIGRSTMGDATLVWSDEFTGSSLSLATDSGGGTWRTKGYEAGGSLSTGYTDFAGSSWNVSPVQHPSGFPVGVSGSVLTITAKRNPGLAGVSNNWIGAYLVTNHLTGLVWRYGYFEWRAQFPDAGRGMFPALWLFNNISGRSDGKEGAELDMLEVFGEPDGQPWDSGWHNNPTPGVSGNAGNFSTDVTGWHRYGIEWTPTLIAWYKDGVQVAQLTGTNATWFATADLGIRINYAMDPNWLTAGDPNKSTTSDPVSGTELRMLVDYVRVFDRKPTVLPTGSDDPLSGPPRVFNVIEEFFHDAGAVATSQTNAGLFNASSFKAVLTTAENTYLTTRHDTFWYFAIPYDRVNATPVEPNYPQTRDNSYPATMAGLVNSYGFDKIYLFGLSEWDNDPANNSWATNRFKEAGATDVTRYDLPNGLTRQTAYNQFMHFYGAANHDGNTDHHQLSALVTQPPEQRGYKIASNTVNAFSIFYGFELGINSICVQVQNDDIAGIIGKIPFVRGGAHQYAAEWGVDMSHSRTYRTGGAGSTTYSAGTLTLGWSADCTKKHLYIAWGSGARQVLSEAIDFTQGPASGQTYNPTGLVFQAFTNFATVRHPASQRPPAHVPVTIIKDHISGLEPQYGQFNQGRSVWYSTFGANNGENLVHNLITTAYPNNSTWGTNTTTGEPIGSTKWGQQFDFVTDRVSGTALKHYPAAFLATDSAAGANISISTLEGFVSGGGVLVLNAKQLTGTAHQNLTGITVGSATTASSPTVTWVADASTTAESGTVPYSTVTLGTATTYARISTSTPFIVQNMFGAGECYTLLGDWGSNSANNALLASTTKLLDILVNRFTKCAVTGGSHPDISYSVCWDSKVTVVTIVNTSTTATSWTGTLTFRTIPISTYTLQEWVLDTTVTNSLVASKVTASVTVPGNEARVFALTIN